MPWPIYRNMSDHDLKSIYQYLSSIPYAEPGIALAPENNMFCRLLTAFKLVVIVTMRGESGRSNPL